MGENSKIEWCHHTFNPWRGCTKVSAGCANCYAEKQAKRNPAVLGIWGDQGTRVPAAQRGWDQIEKWNEAAKQAGEQHRVFCGSMCDIFEDRPELEPARRRVLYYAYKNHNLNWLFLTKRPENIEPMLRKTRHMDYPHDTWWNLTAGRNHPRYNWWFGTSVENQGAADKRLPYLHALKRYNAAEVTFISAEPLLGPVMLQGKQGGVTYNHLGQPEGIDWVIAGGESGPKARPAHPDWFRSLRDQCDRAGVAFHFKQWGEHLEVFPYATTEEYTVMTPDSVIHGVPWSGWKADYPEAVVIKKVGKKKAGRLLDGREHNEFPELSIT